MVTTSGREVWISDIRGLETSLDRVGFQLVRDVSAVPNLNQIEEVSETDKLHIDEMTVSLFMP